MYFFSETNARMKSILTEAVLLMQNSCIMLSVTMSYPNQFCFHYRNIMNNFSSYLDKMGDSETAFIKIGEITGAIAKLQQDQDQTTLNIGFTSNGEVQVCTFF